jgi:hypothetical protein
MANMFSNAAKGTGQQGLRKTVQKGVQKDIINPAKAAWAGKGPVSMGSAARKGTTWGLAFYGGEKALHRGMDKYNEYQQSKTTDQIAPVVVNAVDAGAADILAKYENKK